MQTSQIIDFFLRYLENIHSFITRNWKFNDILLRKNKGEIAKSDFNVRNSKVKGYSFHGFGCLFSIDQFSIDIELSNNVIEFTSWSIYMFSQNFSTDIKEKEIQVDLMERVKSGTLDFNSNNNNFIFISSSI